MKTINYKMKKLLRPEFIQNMSSVYKKNAKYDKNQKFIYFFLWKTRVEASEVITNSLKTLGFVTPIPFDTFPWQK